MKKKTKIWLGVGAFVMAGSGTLAPMMKNADAATLPDFSDPSLRCAPSMLVFAQATTSDAQPTDAGEAGEGGFGDLPIDLAVARTISLMRGHLLIGDQLVREKQWDAAHPHFMHPTEELYDPLRNELKNYSASQFDGSLKALATAVKNKDAAAYAKAKPAVEKGLAAVESGLKKKQSAWAPFWLEAAVETLKVAPNEYEQAVVDGRIAKPVEYQDSRGFILQAESMIESVAKEMARKDKSALQKIEAAFGGLKAAFPTAVPPKNAVKQPGDVLALVSRVELGASALLR